MNHSFRPRPRSRRFALYVFELAVSCLIGATFGVLFALFF